MTGTRTYATRALASKAIAPQVDRQARPGGREADLLALQRAAGNRAVVRLIQAKLAVGSRDDEQEREADRVAAELLHMPDPNNGGHLISAWGNAGTLSHRPCTECGTDTQPRAAEEAEDVLRAELNDETVEGSSQPEAAVKTLRGDGEPLSHSVRAFFEPRLGYELGAVRVHTGERAARSAQALNALAYTAGTDIVFAPGRYQPGTPAGKLLLAHELVHVAQQMFRGAITRIRRAVDAGTPAIAAHPSLADKAEMLGDDAVTMISFSQFQHQVWGWFFSSNNTLAGRASKPLAFDIWDDWEHMHWQSRMVIGNAAGFTTQEINSMPKDEANFTRLKDVYAAEWPANKFAVFQSGAETNTCNLFLGEALFLDGKNQVRNGKYYAAHEVYEGAGRFRLIDKGDVSRGDIAAWGGHHVEIVTAVDLANDSFCSRGGYRVPMGGEKCADSSRRVSLPSLRFLRVR